MSRKFLIDLVNLGIPLVWSYPLQPPFLAMSSPLLFGLLLIRDLGRGRSGENPNAFTVMFKLSYCCFRI